MTGIRADGIVMSDLLLVTDQLAPHSWAANLRVDGHELRLLRGRDELLAELATGCVDGVLVDHPDWVALLTDAPVRELVPHARVLVVASPDDLLVRTDLDALGVHDLVVGPVDAEALARRIRRRFPTAGLVASER